MKREYNYFNLKCKNLRYNYLFKFEFIYQITTLKYSNYFNFISEKNLKYKKLQG